MFNDINLFRFFSLVGFLSVFFVYFGSLVGIGGGGGDEERGVYLEESEGRERERGGRGLELEEWEGIKRGVWLEEKGEGLISTLTMDNQN